MPETSFVALINTRNEQARKRIGNHFLVGIGCGNGFVFARRPTTIRLTKTENQPGHADWSINFNKRIVVASIGEGGDANEFLDSITEASEELCSFVSDRYLTHKYVADVTRRYLKERYDDILRVDPYAVTAISAALDDSPRFCVFDFTGRMRKFSFFAVTGCVEGDNESRKRRDGAIGFLTEQCGNGQSVRWGVNDRGTRTILDVFRKFDPPQKGELIQFVWSTHDGLRSGFRSISKTKKTK
ncbi:MAG: hypothetical protein AAB884_02135 [Patescibacteria group bacterium]